MEATFAVVLGLVFGSFLNVCIFRLPLEMSIVSPRSRCPKCKRPISWYENIPVLSYVFLRGRCRGCNERISIRYPFVEALTGIVSMLLYFKFGFGSEWLIFLALSAALIVLAFIDIDHRMLPDPITLNGIWVGILANVYLAQSNPLVSRLLRIAGVETVNPRLAALIASVLGALVGGSLLWVVGEVYLRLRGVEGMGLGDVKMMAMVGAFLGAPLALLTIMIGSLLGSVIGLAFILLAGKTRDYELPFGTFLSFAGLVSVLYGDDLIRWYVENFLRPAL